MASRMALYRYSVSRPGSIGHAPASVCHIRYSVSGSGAAPSARARSCQSATAAAHSSGRSASTASRARRSSPRLVSWVDSVVIVAGQSGGQPGRERVKARRAEGQPARLAADLVAGDEPRPAVERGVLHALGRDRAAGLLEPHGQLGPGRRGPASPAPAAEQHGAQRVEHADAAGWAAARGPGRRRPSAAPPTPPAAPRRAPRRPGRHRWRRPARPAPRAGRPPPSRRPVSAGSPVRAATRPRRLISAASEP